MRCLLVRAFSPGARRLSGNRSNGCSMRAPYSSCSTPHLLSGIPTARRKISGTCCCPSGCQPSRSPSPSLSCATGSYDIDIIIRKTLQYALLTGLLALVYFGSVILLQSLTENLIRRAISARDRALHPGDCGLVQSVASSACRISSTAVFTARNTMPNKPWRSFAATARDEVDMDKLTAALLGVVEETMQPEKASLWLKK